MFLSNYHRPAVSQYTEESLFPILPGDKLLSNAELSNVVDDIRRLLPIPDEYYKALYELLIHRFAEFVQSLPILQGGPLGELLAVGLERGRIALKVLRELNLIETNEVFTYALFSAALLQDTGWVTYRRRIMLSDQYGFFVKEWLPYTGSLVGQGKYFKLRYLYDVPSGLNRLLNPIFLSFIMPEKGFALLESDRHLLASWLAWCEGDEDGSGGLGLQLNLVQERLKMLLEKRLDPPGTLVKIYTPSEAELGEAFWKWLKERLKNVKIKVNDPEAGVFRVKDGLVIDDKLFKEFAGRHAKHPRWEIVKKQFLSLGLVDRRAKFINQTDKTAHPSSKQEPVSSKYRSSLFKSTEKSTPLTKPPSHAPSYQKVHEHKVSPYQQYVVIGSVVSLRMLYEAGKEPAMLSTLKAVPHFSKMDVMFNKVSGHDVSGKFFDPSFIPKE